MVHGSFHAKAADGRSGVSYYDQGEEFFQAQPLEHPYDFEILKTGTDCNLAECRASGYPVVEHGKRPLHPQKLYLLTISNPEAWTDSGTRALLEQHKPKGANGQPVPTWKVYTWISYEDLWKQFQAAGDGIKDFCDFKNCPFPHPQDGRKFCAEGDPEKPQPTYLDFASLAGVVNDYRGIQ